MNISPKGIAFIAAREACVLVAYQDGEWLSVGFGHNGPEVKPDKRITVFEAVRLLVDDVRAREPIVNHALKAEVAQHEYDALFSGYYQSGSDLLRDVAAQLNKGDRDEAMAALVSHNRNAKGDFMFGLAKRRWLELQIFAKADYGDLRFVKLYEGNPREVQFQEIEFPMGAME